MRKLDEIKAEYTGLNIYLGEVVQQLALLESRKNNTLRKIDELHAEAAKVEKEEIDATISGAPTEDE